MTPRFLPAGDSALVVEFARTISDDAHEKVMALDAALAATPIAGVLETVPTYRSLMVHFDPRALSAAALETAISALDLGATARPTPRRWLVPVCYDPPHDEDLAEVAAILRLDAGRVAALHCGARYTVVMYGFAPGFVFLGGLPSALALSRRKTPRPPAPPGALTIAGGQALIASVAMPTGWYMLGRTPARLFDPARDPIFPIAVGDHVRLERIDAGTFDAWTRDLAAGSFGVLEASS